MKKTIKVNFYSLESDGCKEWVMSLLKDRFNVEISDDYDYYFVSESIYLDAHYMKEMLNLCKKDCIRIFMGGEAIYPDLNMFDYVVGTTYSHMVETDRVISMPFLLMIRDMHPDEFRSISGFDNSKKNISPRKILSEKTKFCNFIYGNGNAHKMRDDLFYAISKYKRVDSLGMHLKNVNIKNTRQHADWGGISIKLKFPYKFSIAAENACFSGYTSEKIITSMMANTIPIYWGNPYVGELYNPRSFINAADYQNLDELVKYIEEVDKNDDLWCEIMSEPWRTPEQIDQHNADTEKFYCSFYGIFEKDIKDAKRRTEGGKGEKLYVDFFSRNRMRILNKIKNL